MIHISGMGALGAFIAQELACRGEPFTWDDRDGPSGWRACTGSIAPYEDQDSSQSAAGYRYWRNVGAGRAPLVRFMEPVRTIYGLVAPPSRVTRALRHVTYRAGKLWYETLPAWQFNAPNLVATTRREFKDARLPRPTGDHSIVIYARGVGERALPPVVAWGWSALAHVRILPGSPLDLRSRFALHFTDPARTFEQYYMYALAGSLGYLVGSETVLQRAPARMPERAKEGLARFIATAEARFKDILELVTVSETPTEGWRPKPRKVHGWAEGEFIRQVGPREYVTRPLYKSGIQCGPLAASKIAEEILCASLR